MATIDNKYGAGVVYTAAIDLGAKKPLDSRIAVQTITERDAHVTGNRAFPGMQVYAQLLQNVMLMLLVTVHM